MILSTHHDCTVQSGNENDKEAEIKVDARQRKRISWMSSEQREKECVKDQQSDKLPKHTK
jgi:hypothetical protein